MHFLIMQQNNRDLLPIIASYDCYKAMEVRKYLLVHSAEKIVKAVLLNAFYIQKAKLH